MSDIQDEFAADAADETATTDLTEVTNLAMQLLDLEAKVAKADAELKTLNGDLRQVSQVKLPAALKAARMKDFTLENGMKVSMKEDLKVSVPKVRKGDVIEKMREWGEGASVSNVISVDLGKGNDNAVKSLTATAEEMGLDVNVSEDIPTATVKKVLKKRIEEGKNDDLTFFGAFPFTEASVK